MCGKTVNDLQPRCIHGSQELDHLLPARTQPCIIFYITDYIMQFSFNCLLLLSQFTEWLNPYVHFGFILISDTLLR